MIEAAEKCIPTILINYPENASVDLGISPEYVSESDEPQDVAQLIMHAYSNQEQDWARLSEWNFNALPTMSASRSVDLLIELSQRKLLDLNKSSKGNNV
jgi:hypothetical protein